MKAANKKTVRMPYLKGSPLDKNTWKTALRRFGTLILMSIAYVLMSTVMAQGSAVIRYILGCAVMLVMAMLFYNGGAAAGVQDVEIGERLYKRAEAGHEVTAAERSPAFHPLKGLLSSLLGTLPLLICAIVLACTTQQMMTGMGTLPDWMAAYTTRSDVAGGVVNYSVHAAASAADYLRILVRVSIMPIVSMVTGENAAGLLVVERLSPVLVLIPALASGLGYMRGPAVRAQVHTVIAKNTRRRKKAAKKREAARKATLEKNQLN